MPPALCFHALLPSPACPFLLKTSRDGAASPSPGGGYQHVSFMPVNPSPSAFCCLPHPASPAPLWGACPPAPPASSLLLATLPLLLACSPGISGTVPQTGAEEGSAHMFCLPLSCPCSPIRHLCYGRALLAGVWGLFLQISLLNYSCFLPLPWYFASILTEVYPVYFRPCLPFVTN